jgi:hypothetical protein
MARSRSNVQPVPITESMRARVRDHAPEAIARRGTSFWVEQWIAIVQWFVVAGVSLIGLLMFGWDAGAMLAFLLASAWLNVAGDLLRWLIFRRRVLAFAQRFNDDAEVWAVGIALSKGRQELSPNETSRYAVGIGLVVDFLFGGVATGVMLLGMREHGIDPWAAFRSEGPMRWTLLAIIALQALGLLWAVLSHLVGSQREAPLKVTPGARGLGLFILLFMVMGLGDEGRQLWLPLVVANAALLFLGVIAVAGMALMLYEHPRALAALEHLLQRRQ